jgi:hypothetical protein
LVSPSTWNCTRTSPVAEVIASTEYSALASPISVCPTLGGTGVCVAVGGTSVCVFTGVTVSLTGMVIVAVDVGVLAMPTCGSGVALAGSGVALAGTGVEDGGTAVAVEVAVDVEVGISRSASGVADGRAMAVAVALRDRTRRRRFRPSPTLAVSSGLVEEAEMTTPPFCGGTATNASPISSGRRGITPTMVLRVRVVVPCSTETSGGPAGSDRSIGDANRPPPVVDIVDREGSTLANAVAATDAIEMMIVDARSANRMRPAQDVRRPRKMRLVSRKHPPLPCPPAGGFDSLTLSPNSAAGPVPEPPARAP